MPTKKIQILNSIVKTDQSLTEAGTAADSKAVGDKLAALEERINGFVSAEDVSF